MIVWALVLFLNGQLSVGAEGFSSQADCMKARQYVMKVWAKDMRRSHQPTKGWTYKCIEHNEKEPAVGTHLQL